LVRRRIGRKRSLIYAVVCYTLFSLLSAIAWDSLTLGVMRLFTVLGLASMTIIANTYISEFFPAASRGKYQAWTIMLGLIGIPATAWVASFLVKLLELASDLRVGCLGRSCSVLYPAHVRVAALL
jgi:MFS transporter, putative metabolite:H+ symporter